MNCDERYPREILIKLYPSSIKLAKLFLSCIHKEGYGCANRKREICQSCKKMHKNMCMKIENSEKGLHSTCIAYLTIFIGGKIVRSSFGKCCPICIIISSYKRLCITARCSFSKSTEDMKIHITFDARYQ